MISAVSDFIFSEVDSGKEKPSLSCEFSNSCSSQSQAELKCIIILLQGSDFH